jgi:hypothetical protein
VKEVHSCNCGGTLLITKPVRVNFDTISGRIQLERHQVYCPEAVSDKERMLVFSSLHANPIRDFIAYVRTLLSEWENPKERFKCLLMVLKEFDYPQLWDMLLIAQKDSGRRVKCIRKELFSLKQEIHDLRVDLRKNDPPEAEHRMILCIMGEDKDKYEEGHLRELYRRYEFFYKSVDDQRVLIFNGTKYGFQ